jgi:predicted anti-sigma-YlaC factor YlaD
LVLLFKAPNLVGAVIVYTVALGLFHVDVGFGQMLAFLPVIFLAAALPLPFHAGALLLWTVLFPSYPEVGAFSLVMHTFFVIFNAIIGTLFLPRANRELFD